VRELAAHRQARAASAPRNKLLPTPPGPIGPARDWFTTLETLAGGVAQSQQSQPLAQPGGQLVKSQTETGHNLDLVEAQNHVRRG